MPRLALIILGLLSFQLQAQAAQGWTIQGSDPLLGSYQGTLTVEDRGPDEHLITHHIRFTEHRFQGMKVEEVWQQLVKGAAPQVANFKVELSNYIKSFEKSVQAMVPAQTVTLKIPSTSWNVLGRTETLTPAPNPELHDIYEQKTLIRSADKPAGFVAFTAKLVAREFYKMPEMAPYKNHPVLKRGLHFVERDVTNFDYYRSEPNTLRIINAKATVFTEMAEFLRYGAYASTLEEKALAQEKDMQEIMIDDFGLIAFPHLDAQGKLLGHEADLSSALWTAWYMAAQRWRYETTGEPEALLNIRRSLKGLHLLANIHKDPQSFARSLRRIDDPYRNAADQEWDRAAPPYDNLEYHIRGNNDMIKGMVMGLLMAHAGLPDLTENERQDIANDLKRLSQTKIAAERKSNAMITLGALAVVDPSAHNMKVYKKTYREWKRSLPDFGPKGSGIITDWSGNLLGLSNDVVFELIFSKLDPEANKKIMKQSYDDWQDIRLLRPTPHTFFLKCMKEKYAYIPELPASSLEDATWAMREILKVKVGMDVQIDHSALPDFVPSPYPALFWKFLKDEQQERQGRRLSIVAKPLFQGLSLNHMMWRMSPFQYQSGAEAGAPRPAPDYLFAYWLGRKCDAIKAGD